MDEPALTCDDFTDSFGLPRARWDQIAPRVFASETSEQRHALRCAAQREWLRRLRGALPPAYQVLESEHFMVLAAARGDATHLTDYAELARAQVTALLGERPETVGKVAVLIFAAEGDLLPIPPPLPPGRREHPVGRGVGDSRGRSRRGQRRRRVQSRQGFRALRVRAVRPAGGGVGGVVRSGPSPLSRRRASPGRRGGGGESAYGVGLEVWVRQVLGEGDWGPKQRET